MTLHTNVIIETRQDAADDSRDRLCRTRRRSAAASFEELAGRIDSRSARVGVIGQGYVGFPLAQLMAESGFETVGFDVSERVVERSSAQSGSARYQASNCERDLDGCDVFVIAVPTPTQTVHGHRSPDLSVVAAAVRVVSRHIGSGYCLVVSESTYAPGTTRSLMEKEMASGRAEARVAVGYSPERIDPGNTRFGLANIPKIVSGLDETSHRLTHRFYSTFIETVVDATSTEAAEAAKLLENSFRFINITFAQEFDEYCHASGLQATEVTRLAATKPFGYTPFFAGSGIGGHCIAEDPYYLLESAVDAGIEPDILRAATRNHERRGEVIAGRIEEELDRDIDGARVLLLGVTYKPDVADARQSPALPVATALMQRGALVDYHDPFISDFGMKKSLSLEAADPGEFDVAVLLVQHSTFDVPGLRERGWRVVELSENRGAPGARVTAASRAELASVS